MKNVKQSTFSRLLSAIIMILCVVVLGSSIGTILSFNSTRDNSNDEKNFTASANSLVTALDYLTKQTQSYSQFGEKIYYNNYIKEINETKRIDTSLSQLQAIAHNQTMVDQIQEIQSYNDKLVEIENSAIKLVKRGSLHEARKILFGEEYTNYNEKIHEISNNLIETLGAEITNTINGDSTEVNIFGITTIVATLLLILLQLVSVFYTTKHIIEPILKLKDAMIVVSKGVLTQKLDLKRNHTEIGQLAGAIEDTKETLSAYIEEISNILQNIAAQNLCVGVENDYVGDFSSIKNSLNTIISSLNQAFGTINQSVEQISDGSEQVAVGAQTLSQGSTEQASSIEELAATINEISEQVKNNAINAQQASEQASSVGNEMMESNRQMQEMIQAMEDINNSSNEIGKIIKAIEDIAFQTNILALNAAVEAARAGAAGKGFAVVADEVRNLASKSAQASKNTSSLIETSLRAVEHGTQLANVTAKSMISAVDGAGKVAETVNKISVASNTQAESITQITIGVDQISSVIQTNSATAEESAAASEQLSGQAQLLKDIISKYQLKESSNIAAFQTNDIIQDTIHMDTDTGKY